MACEFFNRYCRPCRGPRHGVVDSYTLLDHCGRVLRACGLLLLLVTLSLAGCAAPQRIESPTTQPIAQTQGIVGAIMQGVTGLNYESALSAGTIALVSLLSGMVIGVTKLTIRLSHQREMERIRTTSQPDFDSLAEDYRP